jgi:hypothetical protein
MGSPYIPAKDADFNNWLTNFSTLLTASPTTYGLVAGDATAVAAVTTTWSAAYLAATNPVTRTAVTIADKDAARLAAEGLVRPLAVSVSLNGGVTNMDKTAIGVTVRVTTPTPVPPPTTQPALSLSGAVHNLTTLRYYDTSTPDAKAKPPGVRGIQIFQGIGTVPAIDPSQCQFLNDWTKSPNYVNYDGTQVGKIATFFGRWFTQSGPSGQKQFGPWSAPLSVAIV